MKIFIRVVLSFVLFTGITLAQETVEHTAVDEFVSDSGKTNYPEPLDDAKRNSGFQSFEITYIANEGVLITSNETQILIDALFRGPLPNIDFLSAEERENSKRQALLMMQ